MNSRRAALAISGLLVAGPSALAIITPTPAGALPGYGLEHSGHDHDGDHDKPKWRNDKRHDDHRHGHRDDHRHGHDRHGHHRHGGHGHHHHDGAHAGGGYDEHRRHPRDW